MAQLLAGAAMRKITPSMEQLEAINATQQKIFGNNQSFHGIHEDIYVRAIVLSDGKQRILLGGSDLGNFPAQQKMSERLYKESGIEPIGCILSCTHNHEALMGGMLEGDDDTMMDFFKPTPAIDAYANFVHDMMAEAVAEAVSKLQPARMGVVKGMSYINACRDLPTPLGGIQANNFHGPSDHELTVLKFETADGSETIGMFINHATHSNAMVWNLYNSTYPNIGADIGGGVSRFVEKANKNKFPVAWAMGCAGDQNPIVRSSWRIVDINDNGELSMEQVTFDYKDNLLQMKSLIATQGMEVLDLINQMKDYTYDYYFKGAETYRETPARTSYRELKIQPKCGERPEPVPYHRNISFRFRLANVCGIAFVGLNGEIYTNLGLMIKAMLPCETTVITTCAYGMMGYIPDAKQEWINGFGTINTNARSGAETEAAFKDGFTELRSKVFAG